jgi:hypothetical protein
MRAREQFELANFSLDLTKKNQRSSKGDDAYVATHQFDVESKNIQMYYQLFR